MSASRANNALIRHKPPSNHVLSNNELLTMFKSAVAADTRSAARNYPQNNSSGHYLATKELGPKMITIVTKYARGRHLKCRRCRMCLTLSEALRKLKGCAPCREKAALSLKDWRAGKTADGPQSKTKVRS